MTALVACLGAVLAVLTLPYQRPAGVVDVLLGVGLFAGFLATEADQLHLEVRRQTFSVSLSEIVLVVGLFVVPPAVLLAAAVAGSAAVSIARGTKADKAVFNGVLLGTEVLLAVAVFHAVSGDLGSKTTWPHDYAAWLGAYSAALAVVVLSLAVVSLVVSLVQAPLTVTQVARAAVPAVVACLFSGTVGLLLVLLVATSPWSAVGLVLVVAVLVAAYREFARRVQEHKNLADLYDVTRRVSTSLHGPLLDAALLERVRELLRAETALVWLTEGERQIGTRNDGRGGAAVGPGDAVRAAVMRGRSVLTSRRTAPPALLASLAAREAEELVAVPLRVGEQVVGSLEVTDRQGERARFVDADQALLETLAVHLGVALENARLVERLRHEAYHDPLTSLPNRRAFVERLDAALPLARDAERMAVLVLDLQSFKDVNDTLGRAAGDALLTEVAHRVRSSAPDPEAVARLSSDEIGLFTGVRDLAAANEAASRLQAQLATPVDLDGVEVQVGAVVGIAVHPQHGHDAVTLLQRADAAMYAAKGASRGVLTYLPSMDASSPRRLRMVTELRRAVESGELRVWYQPQVRLDRSELSGLEALVRWQHPEHGVVGPDEFIPVAEHTGLIGPLTSFVLATALADLRAWRDRGHHFGMSVNISVRCLLDPGFVEEVRTTLRDAGTAADLLTLEITESSVMSDPDRAVPVLESLREMGVRLSVDDFGIGQSSLTYLRRLPVSEVKIDKSFVFSMAHSPGDAAIVRAVIDLSRPLGLTVVAEGVESEETRSELTDMGCGVIQGYLLSRPLPKEDLDHWLERRTEADPAGRAGPKGQRALRVVSR